MTLFRENELKTILKEIVDDLEQVRIALARRVEKTGTQSRTAAEIASSENRAAYTAIRKRIDALQVGDQLSQNRAAYPETGKTNKRN